MKSITAASLLWDDAVKDYEKENEMSERIANEPYVTPEQLEWIDNELTALDPKVASPDLIEVLKNPVEFSKEFNHIGEKLLAPVKQVLDRESCCRKALCARTVKPGEVVRYDKDTDMVSYVLSEDGESVLAVQEGNYVYPPESEVSCELKLKEPTLIELSALQNAGRENIIYKEDSGFFNLLRKAAGEPRAFDHFDDACDLIINEFQRRELKCDKLFIPRELVAACVETMSKRVDPTQSKDDAMVGYIGKYRGATLITTAATLLSEPMQPGEIFGLAPSEYIGGMPIRVELMSGWYDNTEEDNGSHGWFWYELLSMIVVNPKTIVYGVVK
jgi:hypothetical protein